MHNTMKRARQVAGHARDIASSAYDQTRHAAAAAYDRTAEAFESAADESSAFIRSYPLTTVLVAFGVGLSVGMLLSKMRA